MQHGGRAQRMGQDRRLAVIDHHLGRHRVEVFKGMLVAGQEVFLGLGQGKLGIHPAAVTEDHDKKREPAVGAADRQKSGRAPIHLGALARGKLQREEGGLARRAHGAHIVLEDAVAAAVAAFPQALEQLLGAEGEGGQQSHHRAFVRIEFAGTFGPRTWLVSGTFDPFADRSLVQVERLGNLGRREVFLVAQLADLLKGLIVNHAAPPSTARRRMSLRLSGCPVRV